MTYYLSMFGESIDQRKHVSVGSTDKFCYANQNSVGESKLKLVITKRFVVFVFLVR